MSRPRRFFQSFIHLKDFTDLPEKEGRYTADFPQFAEWLPSSLECPYCHGHLSRLDRSFTGGVNRVIRVGRFYKDGKRQAATFMRIPETHEVLRCRPCRQGFTMPAEALA